jgi:hypothetical protein
VIRSRVHLALSYFGFAEPDEDERAALRNAPALWLRRAVGMATIVIVPLAFLLTIASVTPVGVAWTAVLFVVVGVLVALLTR